MTTDLDALIEAVIEREGGFVADHADRGGATCWGITQAVARANGFAGDMRAFPRAAAIALYRKLYWRAPGLDRVAARAPILAARLFDAGVNMGPPVAIAFLQRALNALNRGGRDYPDHPTDGALGAAALAALDAFLHCRAPGGEAVLVKAVQALQGERYIALADRRPADERFLYGWLANRMGYRRSGWAIAGRLAYTGGMRSRRLVVRPFAAWASLLAAACSGPGLLNAADGLMPGGPAIRHVARGVAYGPDPRQRLDIWVPAARSADPRPVVVFFYGGGWSAGSRRDYGFAGRANAARGFVAVVPDYRLVPAVRFPAFVQDAALAVKWTRDHAARFGGDAGRITVAGHSAGAYIGAMLMLDPRYLRSVGAPPTTIRAAALLAGPYDFYPWDDPRAVAAFGAWPRPRETQPVAYAHADAPPLWLAYGDADRTVRPANSIALAARLKAVGAPVALRDYPGRGHADLVMGLSRPFRGRASTLADSSAFLLAHSR